MDGPLLRRTTSWWMVLIAIIAVLLAATAIPLQASGLWTDAGATGGNQVQGGVLDLALTEAGPATEEGTTDERNADSVRDTWEDRAHDPLGADTVENTLTLANTASTVDARQASVEVSFSENDSGQNDGNPGGTARTVEVTRFVYDGNDLTDGELEDANGNGRLDLEDLTLPANDGTLSTLAGIPTGETADLSIALSGSTDVLDGVESDDGIDVTVSVGVHTRGFEDVDPSRNNTIRYA